MEDLKSSLYDFILVLSALSDAQRLALVRFERSENDPLKQNLNRLIERADEKQIEFLIRSSQNSLDDPRIQELIKSDSFLQSLTNAQVDAFGCVFRLLLLQETLYQCFSSDQLVQFLEMCRMPGTPADLQLKVLQQFQQLLSQMLPESLRSLHHNIETAPNRDQEVSRVTFQLLESCQDQSLLNQPLARLLRCDLNTMMHIHENFPRLQPIQIVQLVRLMQMENQWGILEIRQLLAPDRTGWQGLQALMEENGDECMSDSDDVEFSLSIIDQPPDRIVYNRCLKPNPVVLVQSRQPPSLGPGESLQIVPVLYRFDTSQPIQFLVGNQPQSANIGSPVVFKRLKVSKTSHQLDDTLFFLRFELRITDGSKQSESLASVQSKPFSVVSHSSLLKEKSKAPVAAVTEVIPPSGSTIGGTRVVIIGSNFEDSPTLLVRFDNTTVFAEFVSPGTLVCFTPSHFPASVHVTVSNNSKDWSNPPGAFTFEEGQEGGDQSLGVSNIGFTETDIESFFADEGDDLGLTEALLQGGFEPFPVSHFAAASDNIALTQRIVNHSQMHTSVNMRDRKGRTPLHWATRYGCIATMSVLLGAGVDVNLQDRSGLSPLHLAVGQDQTAVSQLLEAGANVNLPTGNGLSPLHMACCCGDLDVVSLLLDYGAFINQYDEEGETPLHWAVRESNLPLVQLLLKRGSLVNQQNDDGETALHIALSMDKINTAIISLLASQSSCDLSRPDRSGALPMLLAVERDVGHQLVQSLIPSSPTHPSGFIPALAIAKQRNQMELEQLLSSALGKCPLANTFANSPLSKRQVYYSEFSSPTSVFLSA